MRPTRLLRTTGFRLAALYAGSFGLSVLVLFAVIYWIADDALREQLSATVESEVAAVVEDYQTGELPGAIRAIEDRLASGIQPTVFFLLLDPAGRKVAGNLAVLSPQDGWQELPPPTAQDEMAEPDPGEINDHRLLAHGTALPDGSFLLVGADAYRIFEAEEAIVRAFEWAFGVTLLLGATGGGILSLGFLRRIDAINRTSRAIIDGRLADRVPTRGTGDELDRLALNLNEMLDRLQALMESLRQVSSDIAHDLRTPLSRLRQRLEKARARARHMTDYEAAVDRALADTDAILATFAALLRIAQIEAGTRKAAFSAVDLSDLFQSIQEAYAAVAEDRGQTLVGSIKPDIVVHGDRELLTQMLANLVENAIRHTPDGTAIALALKPAAGGAIGLVADSGPGIPPQTRDKVFRRFFRLERSRSTDGSGLGLSLVAAVAEIHGITVTLDDNEPGLRVRLDFPPGASA